MQKGTFAFVDGMLQPAGGVKSVAAGIAGAVRRLSGAGGKPLLVLENPDFLLAATEGVGALDIADMVLDLREVRGSRPAYGVRVRVLTPSSCVMLPSCS